MARDEGDPPGDPDVEPGSSWRTWLLRGAGQVLFWTVGTIAGLLFGLMPFVFAMQRYVGGCYLDVCMEQSVAAGAALHLLSGATFTLWLKWGAWALDRPLPWWKAVAAGAGMAGLGIAMGVLSAG